MTKHMKSREIRDNWRDVLDHVRAGNEIVVEHYSKPIARIVPIKEPAMAISTQDMTAAIETTLGDEVAGFDIPAIVEEIRLEHGAISSLDDVPSEAYWKIVRSHERSNAVIWSVVEGTSPDARAVEPATAGVDIPADVLEWAEGHGVAVDNPDRYVLVSPLDVAGKVEGEVAVRGGDVSAEDVAAIREVLEQQDAARKS